MNKFVELSIVLALLASGSAGASDVGLCKPLCAEEKRECRHAALKWDDHEAVSLTSWKEKNPMAREFGKGGVETAQPVGPAAAAAKDRKMTRMNVCEDKFKACAKACASQPASSDVLVKPATR